MRPRFARDQLRNAKAGLFGVAATHCSADARRRARGVGAARGGCRCRATRRSSAGVARSGRRGHARDVSVRLRVDGRGTTVTGALLLPKGAPPPRGWPVVGVAHGFTGLSPKCGPSAQPDFRTYATTLAAFLSGRVALAFTDYQGLGGPGAHPFLEPRTAAFNVIDSVRALKAVFPSCRTDGWRSGCRRAVKPAGR